MLMLVSHPNLLQVQSLTSQGVIQDAKFKRREALADLAKAASKQ